MICLVWCRQPGLRTRYCAVVSVDDSRARTACRGSWDVKDVPLEQVDTQHDPLPEERCAACVRNAPIFEFDCSEGVES